ncbi:hypothetical protein AND_006174 [Anopheles darlingi]|uniref:C2H2-type domain-containing protein n=1 Tax=Anopheles darlingi TaxID=43151 RepID=W5JCR2_ANODA|nr:hypothetical protein AND_006174 [Anopheles darlingi]
MKLLPVGSREHKQPDMNLEDDIQNVASQICRSSSAPQVDTPKIAEKEQSKTLHPIDITQHSSASRRTTLRRTTYLRDDASSPSSSVINNLNENASQHSSKQFNNETSTKLHLTTDLLTSEPRLVCSLPLERLHSILESLNLTKKSIEIEANSGNLKMSLFDKNSTICKVLCLYCDRTFNNQQLMRKHSDRTHRVLKKCRSSTRVITASSSADVSSCCSLCNKGMAFSPASQDLTRLFKHMIKFHADQYHACEHCFIRFPNEESRLAHFKLMHPTAPANIPATKSKAALKAFGSGIPGSGNYSSAKVSDLDSSTASLQEKQKRTKDIITENEDGGEHVHRTTTIICSEDSIRSNIRLRSSLRNSKSSQPLNNAVLANESKSKSFKKSQRLIMRNTEPMLLSRLGIAQHRLPRQSRRLLAAAAPTSVIPSDVSASNIVRGTKKKIPANVADEVFSADNCNEKVTRSKRSTTSISPTYSSAISHSPIDINGCRSKAHENSSISYTTACNSNNNIQHSRTSGSATCSASVPGNSVSIISGGSAVHVITNNFNSCANTSNVLFDEDFYENVTNNVHQNLSCYLDGKLYASKPNTPSPISPVVVMPAVRSTVVKSPFSTESMIHEATNLPTVTVSFPTLLTAEQYGRDSVANLSVVSKTRKPITKQSWKWKWDFVKKYKYVNENGRIVKKIKQPMMGLRDLTKLDMWTQLSMRSKHEYSAKLVEAVQNSSDRPILEVGAVLRQEKRILVEQLNQILNARLFPPIDLEQQDQRKVKLESNNVVEASENNLASAVNQCSASTESNDSLSSVFHQEQEFLHTLQLVQMKKHPYQESVVLSGEWARPRCYVCYGCGTKFASSNQMEEHNSARHPLVYSTCYEIVGRELIENHLYRHFFIPLTALKMQRLYCQKYLHCGMINDLTSIKWQNSQRMAIGNHEIKNEDSSSNEATSFSTVTSASSCTSSSYSNSFNSSAVTMLSSFIGENCKNGIITFNADVRSGAIEQDCNPIVCSKCFKECSNLLMLYAHILHCSNDYFWIQAKKRMKYRRAKRRRGGGYRNTINNLSMALADSGKNVQKPHPFMTQALPAESAIPLLPSATSKTALQDNNNANTNVLVVINGDHKKNKSSKLKESDGDIVKRLLANLPEKRNSRQISQRHAKDKHTRNRLDSSSSLNIDIAKLSKNARNSDSQNHTVTNRATRRIATENSLNSNAKKYKKSLPNLGKLMKKNQRKTSNAGSTSNAGLCSTATTTWKTRVISQTAIPKSYSTTPLLEVEKKLTKPRIKRKDSKSTLSRTVLLKVAGKKKQISKSKLIPKGTVVIKNAAKWRRNTLQLRNLSTIRHTVVRSNHLAEYNEKKSKTVVITNVADDKNIVSFAKPTECSNPIEFLQNEKLLTEVSIEQTLSPNKNENIINHSSDKGTEENSCISRSDKTEIYCNAAIVTKKNDIDLNGLNHRHCESFSGDDNGQTLASSESGISQTKLNEPFHAFQMPLQRNYSHLSMSKEANQTLSAPIRNSTPQLIDTLKQPFEMEEPCANYISPVSLAVGNQPIVHKRRPKKLIDCIAMLTGKLSERFGVDFFSQSDRNGSLKSISAVQDQLSPPLKCSSKENEMVNVSEKQNSHINACETLIVPESNINAFPAKVIGDTGMGESNTVSNNVLANFKSLSNDGLSYKLPVNTAWIATALCQTPEKSKQSVNHTPGTSRTSSKCLVKELKITNQEKSTSTIASPVNKKSALNVEQLSEVSDEPLNLCKNNSLCSKNDSHPSNYSLGILPTLAHKIQQSSLAFNGLLTTMTHSSSPYQQREQEMSNDTSYVHQISNGMTNEKRGFRKIALPIDGVPAHNSLSVSPKDGSGNLASIKLPPGLIIERVECKQSRPIVSKEIPSVTIVARNRSPLRTVDKRNLNALSCSISKPPFARQQQPHTTNNFPVLIDTSTEGRDANENVPGTQQYKVQQKNQELNGLQQHLYLKDNELSSSTRHVGQSLYYERGSLIENHISVTITTANRIDAHQVTMEKDSLYQAKNNTITFNTGMDQQHNNTFERIPFNTITSSASSVSPTVTPVSHKCPQMVTKPLQQNHGDKSGRATLIIPQVPMPPTITERPRRKSFFSAISSRSPMHSTPVDTNTGAESHTSFENNTTSNEETPFKAIGPKHRSPTLSEANLLASMPLSLLHSGVCNGSHLALASVRLPPHLKPPEIPPLTIPSLGSTPCIEHIWSQPKRSREGTTCENAYSINRNKLLATKSSLQCSSISEKIKPMNITNKLIIALKDCSSHLSDDQETISRQPDISECPEKVTIQERVCKTNGEIGTVSEKLSLLGQPDISECPGKVMIQERVCKTNGEIGTVSEKLSLSGIDLSSGTIPNFVQLCERQVDSSNCILSNDIIEAKKRNCEQQNDKEFCERPQQTIEQAENTIDSLEKNPSTQELSDTERNVTMSSVASDSRLDGPSRLTDAVHNTEANKQVENHVHEEQYSKNATAMKPIHEKNEVEADLSRHTSRTLSDSGKSTSDNSLASPMQKVTRKRRKNELASILSDQLLESFKEVDKSKLNDLKLLHDITCQTPYVKFSLEQIPQLAKRKSNPPKQELFESNVRGVVENEVKLNTSFTGQKNSRSKTPVKKSIWTVQHQMLVNSESISNSDSTKSQRLTFESINDLTGDAEVKQNIPSKVGAPIIMTSLKQSGSNSIKRNRKHTNDRVTPIVGKPDKTPTTKQTVEVKKNVSPTMTRMKNKPKTNETMLGGGNKMQKIVVVDKVNENTGSKKSNKTHSKATKVIRESSDGTVTGNNPASDRTIALEENEMINVGVESVGNIKESIGETESKNEKDAEELFVTLKEGILPEGNLSRKSSEQSSASVIIDPKIQPVRETITRMTRRKSVFVDRDLAQYMCETKPPEVNSFKDDLILTSRRGTRSQGNKSLTLVNNFVEATMKPRDPRRRLVQKRLETEQCNVIPLQETQGAESFKLISYGQTSTGDEACKVTSEGQKIFSDPEEQQVNTSASQKDNSPVRRILTRRASVFVRIPTPELEKSSSSETVVPQSTRSDMNLRTISIETKRIYRRRASIHQLSAELLDQTESKATKNEFENFTKHQEKQPTESTANNRFKMTSKCEPIRGKCDPLFESLLLQTDTSSPSGAKKRTTKNSQIAETFSKLFNIQEEIRLIDSTKRKFKKNNNVNHVPLTKETTNVEQQCVDHQTSVETQNFFSSASNGNSVYQTSEYTNRANNMKYSGSDTAIYCDSGDDNISLACFVARQKYGRGEYSSNLTQPIAAVQPSITTISSTFSNTSKRALSVVDDESTMNTDGMDDAMSVTTDIHHKNVAEVSGRRKRKRLISLRRGNKIQRQKAKAHSEIDKPVVTYNCDLCNKMFKKQDAYNKHRMTLTHIAKLSEQEFLLLQQRSVVSNVSIRPRVHGNASSGMTPLKCDIIDGNEERKNDSKVLSVHEKKAATALLEPTTLEDSVKTLSQEEKLFYECCSMLKESNTDSGGRKLNVTVPLKSIEKEYTNPILESVKKSSVQASPSGSQGVVMNANSAAITDSCFQMFHDPKQPPDLRAVNGPLKGGRNVMSANDNPKNNTKSAATGICFLPASHSSNNNTKIKTKGALKGYDNFKVSIPMTELMMAVCDETSDVIADVNFPAAKDSRLETLADVALCNNITTDFASMSQNHNGEETERLPRENQIKSPNDSLLPTETPVIAAYHFSTSSECGSSTKKEDAIVTQVSTHGSVTDSKCKKRETVEANLSKRMNQQNKPSNRTTRNSRKKAESSSKSTVNITALSVNAERISSDTDIYAFQDSPSEGFAPPSFTSKKYFTALRLPAIPENNAISEDEQLQKSVCIDYDDSQMSSLSFSDRDDFVYGTNTLTDEDEVEDSQVRKNKDEDKSGSNRSPEQMSKNDGKADNKKKCLIMGRIFRKGGNKEKMKNTHGVKDAPNLTFNIGDTAASVSVDTVKKDFDKLFDTLKNADDVDCKSLTNQQITFPSEDAFNNVHHSKLVETWDSEEYDDFHTDDILQMLDDAEMDELEQPMKSSFLVNEAPQKNQTNILHGNSKQEPIERSSDIALGTSSTLGIDVGMDQKCSDIGVVTDYTIRKVMESVILETMSKSSQKTINKNKISRLQNCVANNNESVLCQDIASHGGFPNHKRSIKEINATGASNEILSNLPTSIEDHVLESSVLISSRTITTKFKQKLNSSLQRSTISKLHDRQTRIKPQQLLDKNEKTGNNSLETSKSSLIDNPVYPSTIASQKNTGDAAVSIPNRAEVQSRAQSSSREFKRLYKVVSHSSDTPKCAAIEGENAILPTGVERKNLASGIKERRAPAHKQRKTTVKKMKNVAYDPDSDFEDNIKCKKVKRKLLESDIEGNLKMEKLKSTLNDNTILLPLPRRKRNAGDMLYYWSSTSDEDDGSDSRENIEFESKRMKSSDKIESIITDVIIPNGPSFPTTLSPKPQKAKLIASGPKTSKKPKCDSNTFLMSKNSPPRKKIGKTIKPKTRGTCKAKEPFRKEKNSEKHSSGVCERKKINCFDRMGSLDPSEVEGCETSSSSDQLQQHGWIVGDSHKKLVTLLAHAKGKQDSRKAINQRRK